MPQHKASKSRTERQAMAEEMLRIIETGSYAAPSGDATIDIRDMLNKSVNETIHYHFSHSFPTIPITERRDHRITKFSVQNIPSIQAALELAKKGGGDANVGVMNFASAKNPGGGFLGGSLAQEESLCYSSLLYPTLEQFANKPDHYYQINRHPSNKGLYTDCAIYSPQVPVIRDGMNHQLLDKPVLVSFVTIPAPNKGAYRGDDSSAVNRALEERIRRALHIFAENDCTHLVLGAFGCGVFKNDPSVVAEVFRTLLTSEFRGTFEEVVFAVLVTDKVSAKNTEAFNNAFGAVLST